MRPYFTKIAFLLFALYSFVGCSSQIEDKTWDIIAVGLPQVVNPSIAEINMGLYLLKQTHEPLFRYRKRTELYSNLLKKWDRDSNYRIFNFCLRDDLYFSKNHKYGLDGLKSTLLEVLNNMNSSHAIEIKGDCLLVQFENEERSFLDALTKYKYAPSKASINKKWEDGLGHFLVTNIGPRKISLKRKREIQDGYNYINFWAYNGANDAILKKGGIEDYNRVLIQDLPLSRLKNYQKYNVALLQTINLVLNIHDPKLRKRMFHCLDIDEFRQAFMSKQKSFLDTGTILPIGIPYSKKSRVKQNCNKKIVDGFSTVKFYNWNKSSSKSLESYFSSLKKKLGLDIKVVNITMNQFVDMILKSPHPYDLTAVALDAVDINYEAYFSPIIENKSIIDVKRKHLRKLYKSFKMNGVTKDGVESINSDILNKHLILPLYQEVRDFYFPKHIKSLTLGKNDLEYLEISELRI